MWLDALEKTLSAYERWDARFWRIVILGLIIAMAWAWFSTSSECDGWRDPMGSVECPVE